MRQYYQDEHQLCSDLLDMVQQKGWEYVMESLYLLAKSGYQDAELEAALFATLDSAKRYDREIKFLGMFLPQPPPPRQKLRAPVRRSKKLRARKPKVKK